MGLSLLLYGLECLLGVSDYSQILAGRCSVVFNMAVACSTYRLQGIHSNMPDAASAVKSLQMYLQHCRENDEGQDDMWSQVKEFCQDVAGVLSPEENNPHNHLKTENNLATTTEAYTICSGIHTSTVI